jgi:transposase
VQAEYDYEQIIIGMESSNGYAAPLDRMLQAAGFTVIAVNSLSIDKYRKLVGQARKDDPYDARLVCEYVIDIYCLKGLRNNAQEIGNPDQASLGKLRVLTRHYRTTKRDLTRVTNRLRKHILGYFPDFLQVFGDLHTKTARTLLKRYNTVSQIKRVRTATLAKLKISPRRTVGPKAAAKLTEVVAPIDYLDPLEAAMGQMTHDLVVQLDMLISQLEELEQEIGAMADKSRAIQHIAAEVSGAGIFNSSELLAEIGDITRFATRDKLSIYCGIGCLNHSSGKMVGARKPIHINHNAKGAVCMMAQAAIIHDAESRAYYDKKRQEGKAHWHAIKCLSKYLLRRIFRLLAELEENATVSLAA